MTDAFDEEIVECLQRLVELLCEIGPNPRKLKVGGLQVCLRPRLITTIQEGAEGGVTDSSDGSPPYRGSIVAARIYVARASWLPSPTAA
jgi:hypothetical protein